MRDDADLFPIETADYQADRDDRAELVSTTWPPPHWAEHEPRCFTDHGLPDICRCGKGWS